MTEKEFAEALAEMAWDLEEMTNEQVQDIRSFRDGGMLTMDEGFTVTIGGETFHVTIQKG